MCLAVRVVRGGDTGYLRASKYFSVPRAKSGELREGYIPFLRRGSKCAFREENCSAQ